MEERTKEMFFRLLVNLTKPPLVCFDGKIPKDVTSTNIYLKIESHLQKTKPVCLNTVDSFGGFPFVFS